MRISDWSSDVCSSDLSPCRVLACTAADPPLIPGRIIGQKRIDRDLGRIRLNAKCGMAAPCQSHIFSTTLSDVHPICPRRYPLRSAIEAPSYCSGGQNFPILCEYSFHSVEDAAATALTVIRTSRRVARSPVSRPEWSIPRSSRSPIPAPEHRRCSSTIREAVGSIWRGHRASRPRSCIAPPRTAMKYETRTARKPKDPPYRKSQKQEKRHEGK